MASSVTPPAEEEEAKVDGAVEARGATIFVQGCLERSYAILYLAVVVSLAHMNVKWGNLG